MAEQETNPNEPNSSHSARAFYNQYVAEHVPYHRSPKGPKSVILRALPYWSYREWRFWRRWVPLRCRLLDLGCARGREVFVERAGSCVGVDLARPALSDCRENYALALEGSLDQLPFDDESFDCVVSSHVFGHIPVAAKAQIVSEIARVLRPGGRSLHVVETDCTHPWIELAKRHPDLYQKHLVEPDGHIGMERAEQTLSRFSAAGLIPTDVYGWDAGRLHPRLMSKWFDNELKRHSADLDREVQSARKALDSPLRMASVEIELGLLDRLLPGPLEQCPFMAVVLERRLGEL